jgi:hypothetical protein
LVSTAVGLAAAGVAWAPFVGVARADSAPVLRNVTPVRQGADPLATAQLLYRQGQYFTAARFAFSAAEGDPARVANAYSWVAVSLDLAGLHQAASYFFIRTLQTGHRPAIRRVLARTESLLLRGGGDLLRKYLLRHTAYEDYDPVARGAFLYALAKEELLRGQPRKALEYLRAIGRESALGTHALQLSASAHAILGDDAAALADFALCRERAEGVQRSGAGPSRGEVDPRFEAQLRREAGDLAARCRAGEARTLYQGGKFSEADRAYDSIPKESLVWPEILFEQAWNAFGRQEYNKALGKLVTYRSPALEFVFNPETEVLRAQSYLALCMISDTQRVLSEFDARYLPIGEKLKRFVEARADDLPGFYEAGKRALRGPLFGAGDIERVLNRFVRSPYFQALVAAEEAVTDESAAIELFSRSSLARADGGAGQRQKGFSGFLANVLEWRKKSVRLLGGAFVKNSLLDHHRALIDDFEKMSFIRLEMLSQSKQRLLAPSKLESKERVRGNVWPRRRDDQMRWGFNGEFWADELGDYVFGLESECGKPSDPADGFGVLPSGASAGGFDG